MLYAEYMRKAKELNVLQNDETGIWYLNPDWKITLYDNMLGNIKTINAPFAPTWNDIEDVLRLEVVKRNDSNNKRLFVDNWLYELITQQVDPAVMQEETEYIANVMDYLKFKSEHPEIAEPQSQNIKDDKLKEILKSGMSFTKKLN